MSTVLTTVLTGIASFVGAWLAAHFALNRFYRERLWERKTAAYAVIFEALFDMNEWLAKHRKAKTYDRPLGEDEKTKLSGEYQEVKHVLQRRLAAESWIIPGRIQLILNDMIMHLDTTNYGEEAYLREFFDSSYNVILEAEKKLRDAVRCDLGLDRQSVFNLATAD